MAFEFGDLAMFASIQAAWAATAPSSDFTTICAQNAVLEHDDEGTWRVRVQAPLPDGFQMIPMAQWSEYSDPFLPENMSVTRSEFMGLPVVLIHVPGWADGAPLAVELRVFVFVARAP
jgi:hypothetical protein